ncbi:propionate catabolism operon regulatory protein PrpR [Chitinimonas sp.]|uniref:propionate catabolism operon regulatory protein PrpR n=1 Tax=Chitinimonas sp. TaxID=1934313 RepID=UPI002F93FE5A
MQRTRDRALIPTKPYAMPRTPLPQIAVVATRALAERIRALLPRYADQCAIGLIEKTAEQALEGLQAMVKRGEIDAVVAAGRGAALLRDNLPLPVAGIAVSGYDILHALADAQALGSRVTLLSRTELSDTFAHLAPLLKVEVRHQLYQGDHEAQAFLSGLTGQTGTVVIGSSQVVQWARDAGLAAVLLYSPEAVSHALDGALELVRIARLEEAKRERLDVLVESLSEGVVAVGRDGRVESINPALARLIGVAQSWAQGRRWAELAPALSLDIVLKSGEARRDEVVVVGGRTLVTQQLPLLEGGEQVGAVLTLQESAAIERADRKLRAASQRSQFRARYRLEDVLGVSPAISTARQLALRYAGSEASVLILGESGTGKELFAQGIHLASRRADGPFVALNCAAFPEQLLESELFGYEEGAFTGSRRGGKPGLIELADRGTLFLDEIGDMPLPLQTRLLRVLQEREVIRLAGSEPIPVDVRIVAATHAALRQGVAARTFRMDLYYRLAILTLELPRLADRGDDIRLIAESLATDALRRMPASLTPAALVAALLAYSRHYHWPGNVRELQNLVERCATLAASGTPLDRNALATMAPELSDIGDQPAAIPLPAASRSAEAAAALAACGGDRQAAARQLGISRTTLWRLLKAD